MVKIRFSDLVQIIRAQAFLARRGAGIAADVAKELAFKLLHACRRKENRRIIFGHDRIAGDDRMAFGRKKIQEFFLISQEVNVICLEWLSSRWQG